MANQNGFIMKNQKFFLSKTNFYRTYPIEFIDNNAKNVKSGIPGSLYISPFCETHIIIMEFLEERKVGLRIQKLNEFDELSDDFFAIMTRENFDSMIE